MDKNSLIGLLLIGAVIIGYTWYTAPTAEEMAEQAAQTDSLRTVEEDRARQAEVAISTPDESVSSEPIEPEIPDSIRQARRAAQADERFGIFSSAANGTDEEFIIENDKFKAAVVSKGGQLKWLELKEYKAYAPEGEEKGPLMLFDERSEMNFRFSTMSGRVIDTRELYLRPTASAISISGDQTSSFTMRLATDDPGQYLDLTYGLKGDSYEIDMSIDMVGLKDEVDLQRSDLMMHWSMTGLFKEKNIDRERERSSVFYRYMDEDRDYLSETSDEEEQLSGRANWIAFKQNFFSAVALHPDGFPSDNGFISISNPEKEEVTKEYLAELTLPIEYSPDARAEWKFYMGPNDYTILKKYENEMDRIIDLGWGIFGWMNKWLVIPIFNFLSDYIGSYGIIILILTIVIKTLLFPLTYKNYLSSAKMKVIRPEIEELNKKFENEKDPMKKQQATMALYRKSGVNPAAGCLPMLVQMPILYAMFRFFPASIELRQQSFLWADDLSAFDSIAQLPFDIPFYGSHVSLFTVLMAASTFFYTRMNSAQMPAAQPGMPNMKMIMNIFPLMMLFFFNNFASGLSYYYLLANIFSIGQMFVIKNLIIDEDKLHAQIQDNKKKPKKKSNFQKRLEEAAKKRGYPAK
ncbi:MAG: membrane protein insertase YidC [Flavobacteriales bacterium]|nr:membrane protein insertase YidC [Flavobacteriales bacterium]